MVMMRYNANTFNTLRFDLNTTAYFYDNFQAGISYKLKESFAAFVAVRYNKIQLRYLFELPVPGKIQPVFTSHMIQLGISFGQKIN